VKRSTRILHRLPNNGWRWTSRSAIHSFSIHERAKVDLRTSDPRRRAHIVENQLAEAIPEVVAAFERLRHEGFDRHTLFTQLDQSRGSQFELMKNNQSSPDPTQPFWQVSATLRQRTGAPANEEL